MPTTHILFFAMPRMLRELVSESLGGDRDVSFAGSYATPDDVERALERLDGSRYVLIGTNGLAERTIKQLVGRHPQAKLLVLTQDGRQTFLYELRPHRKSLGAVSPQKIAAAVREP